VTRTPTFPESTKARPGMQTDFQELASLKVTNISGRIGSVTAMAGAAVAAFVAYLPALRYPFTGTDTFTLIETSRINSAGDLATLLTKPLMWHSRFMTQGMFYRPVAALSYTLDERIWGLNPFGYHLTDVLLHALVAVLVVMLVAVLTDYDRLSAGTAGVLFAVHPILVESVPAPDHRHDVMAAALLIASLLFFLKSVSQDKWRKTRLTLSVIFYVIALGAKEIVIFFPVLVSVYSLLFLSAGSFVRRSLKAVSASLPFFVTTAAYLLWRMTILGSLGGYRDHVPTGEYWSNLSAIVVLYLQDLLYPQDYVGIYDFISRSTFVVGLTVCGTLALWGWVHLQRTASSPKNGCEDPRLAVFLSVWMLLPLMICLATMTFSHRSMYIPAIPLSALLSCIFMSGLRHLTNHLTRSEVGRNPVTGQFPLFQRFGCPTIFAATVALIGSLLAASPMVRNYDEWRDCAEMSSLLFQRLSQVLPSLPDPVTVHLHGVPSAITGYEDRLPRVRGVGYLNDYSIASWFDLFHPDRRISVVVHDRFSPERLPHKLRLRVDGADPGNPQITVEYPDMRGRKVMPGG
jgi:hypothetical protein